MRTSFINIDLEILTQEKPKRLLEDLGDRILVLHSGARNDGFFTSLQISAYRKTPTTIMREFKRVFESLSLGGRTEWEKAIKREYNFGYETDSTPVSSEISLSPEILSIIDQLGASLGITVYNNEQISEQNCSSLPEAALRAPPGS